MSALNIQLLYRKLKKIIPKLSPSASWHGTAINPQWLEPPMSRTIFYGSKDVRAVEVRLYVGRVYFIRWSVRILQFTNEKSNKLPFETKNTKKERKQGLGMFVCSDIVCEATYAPAPPPPPPPPSPYHRLKRYSIFKVPRMGLMSQTGKKI